MGTGMVVSACYQLAVAINMLSGCLEIHSPLKPRKYKHFYILNGPAKSSPFAGQTWIASVRINLTAVIKSFPFFSDSLWEKTAENLFFRLKPPLGGGVFSSSPPPYLA